MIDPARTENKGAAPRAQAPLIPKIAAIPVMLLETIPTQSFSFPRLAKITTTRLMMAIAIIPTNMVATTAARDSMALSLSVAVKS